jgi:acyl-CoA dehydrogenase
MTLPGATLLKTFQKVLPSMSNTEKEALNAGSVWWDGERFSGRSDWSKTKLMRTFP